MTNCQHEQHGRKLAALHAEYGQQRNISSTLNDIDGVRLWDSEQQRIKAELVANYAQHRQQCGIAD